MDVLCQRLGVKVCLGCCNFRYGGITVHRYQIAGVLVSQSRLIDNVLKIPPCDTVLPGDQRFRVLQTFNNDAVRDNETGLVWEKIATGAGVTWAQASYYCINKSLGGRKAWRLHSIAELLSLVDSGQSHPAHP